MTLLNTVVENLDQPSLPVLGVHSSKPESVSRGEVSRELVSLISLMPI